LRWDDMPRGTYDGSAHIADMSLDGVDASVLYPDFMRGVYEWTDREVALACITAYNDWLLDDFCAADPQRLVGMCILPTDDGLEELTGEARRTLAKGARGFFLPYFPERPLFDPYYDPLWSVISGAGAVASLHSGFGGKRPYSPRPLPDGVDSANISNGRITQSFFSGIAPLTDVIFGGVFVRFPTLKFLVAEVNAGWMPYWMQEMRDTSQRNARRAGRTDMITHPDEYIGTNVFVTVLADHVGFKHAQDDERIANAMLYSTDYMHSITLWPHSQEVIPELTVGLAEAARHKILAGNAVRIFNLEPD
jgi:predicted TIM-barrel fold metal-dependent hydrolase